MPHVDLNVSATSENFCEVDYLAANPDVACAIANGTCPSAQEHFTRFGRFEGRQLRRVSLIGDLRRQKMRKLSPFLRKDMPYTLNGDKLNFITDSLRRESGIVDTENVSSNSYDGNVESLITEYVKGLVLDCGAGMRDRYYDNVINMEIVDYDTTDVIAVGEHLPFESKAFDGVISIAVLEHVKDPFRCASEMARVLKPGGRLICCVPFLQPLHGYPHHYYNMSHQGLRALFESTMQIDKQEVNEATGPIFTLTWIVQSWAQGLPKKTRKKFLDMRLSDLVNADPWQLQDHDYVKQLPLQKKFELASATILSATKR